MTLADRDGIIWMDGEYVPWRDAKVHVLTHTLHYGLGCFEGVRAYKTDYGAVAFRLADHTQRLLRSAHILQMPVAYDQQTLNEVQLEVVRRNHLDAAYIRPLIYYGAESLGLHALSLNTHVAIAAWKWGAYLGAENLQRGIRICTSSYIRHHSNSAMTKAKANGQYINSMLALAEATAHGYDEALMLDENGFVAEGSGENFFMINDGVLYTPSLTSALSGITRATIITLARENKVQVEERVITRDETYIADECFFTGTAAEITPIREIDGRTIGDGKRGPITEHLQTRYFDQVHGRTNQHPEWLTYVNQDPTADLETPMGRGMGEG